MPAPANLIGQRFGRLLVESLAPKKPRQWCCVCDCGNRTYVPTGRLRIGNTTSCGCRKRTVLGDAVRTHGQSNSRITGYANRAYGIWQAMRDRCQNPNRKDYHRYGGRGIEVCPAWSSFEQFLADMGNPPEGLTLDRRDNDKGYSPDNCRWATREAQTHNSSRIRFVTVGGDTKPLTVWLAHCKLPRATFYNRLHRGFTEVEALFGRTYS